MRGKRVRVMCNGSIRHGTITDFLTKEETKRCLMYGQLVEVKMDDTGKEEEFSYGYSLEEDVQ